MLDHDLLEQLRGLFANLEAELTLALSPSDHASQPELRAMLEAVATTSPKLRFAETGTAVEGVRFEVWKDGKPTGVAFRAVPGGHEFSSLVLAILHADGKGKQPDAGIVGRIRALQGPAALRTYMSLSCTNCPDVVQALNLITLLHGDFAHETIDGGLAEAEIEKLGIQGVPTVLLGDRIIHVGRSSLAELLELLEEKLGKRSDAPGAAPATPMEAKVYDVVVIGGGPAGASAAIYSARKGLKTAVIAQRVGGQMQETVGIENLISVPYTEGPKVSAALDQHMRSYPIDVLEHRKVERLVPGAKKELQLAGGEIVRADTVIIATGARWRELGVPGEKEYLGRGVAFCPHCDGPFYKGKRIAVVGGGNSGVEAAIDLSNICAHVTLFEFADKLKADDVLVKNLLARSNVRVVTSARTAEVLGNGTTVTGVRYQDRTTEKLHDVELDGVFVQIGLVPNSALAKDVLTTNRMGEIVIDEKNRTNVPGVYAAGDVTTVPFKQIIIAMGEGAKAALTAFEDRMRAG